MPDDTDKFSVLIVEDHALTLFGLKSVLSAKSFIGKIFEANNANIAIDILNENKIDVAIVDIGLPDINGIDLTKKIKDISKNTKIIILTSHNEQREVIDSLKNGARAFCSKEIDIDRLCEVIKHVLDGALWIDGNVAETIIDNLGVKNTLHEKSIDAFGLTTREKEILKLLVNGYDNLQMSKKLSVSLHTVKAHICNILQKLHVEDRTQAVIKVFKLMN